MFAVIETGGKQYIAEPGAKLRVEKLADLEEGNTIIFDKVLLIADEKTSKVGAPYVEKAKVEATVLKQARARKIAIMRYQSKTRRRRRQGHRQPYTEIEIKSIK
ncbi:MAG: 50S ribosomal protein L21 [bacterium]|nr:50S ribosomal protein L21 [bacterium]